MNASGAAPATQTQRTLRDAARRRASAGGEPKRLLLDFLVGAHVCERADRLLTLDPQRYRQAFDDSRIEP